MGGDRVQLLRLNPSFPVLDGSGELLVQVAWEWVGKGEDGGKLRQFQAVQHRDWPSACDHMRRLIDTPGVVGITVRRGT